MNKKLENLMKMDDEKCRVIGKLATQEDIPYLEAQAIHENDLAAYAIGELAKSTGKPYKEAKKLFEQTVAYTKQLIEQDQANEDLGICAEECEIYGSEE